MSNFFFYASIYEAVAKTYEYPSSEVLSIAEQLVKVFINSFCNAITLLSQTLAKTENFGQNLNTVEEKGNKYIYRYAVYLNHGKFLSNADPDLNENNVGSTDRDKQINC